MGADKTDEHHAPVMVHSGDESIIVAFNVKNYAVVRQEAGGTVGILNVIGRSNAGLLGTRYPKFLNSLRRIQQNTSKFGKAKPSFGLGKPPSFLLHVPGH